MLLSFASLRARLIAAFVAVIALSLLLVSGAFVVLVREYHTEREKNRLEDIARAATVELGRTARGGASLAELDAQLREYAESARVRILLLGPGGTVLRDSEEGDLVGRAIPIPPVPRGRSSIARGTIDTPGGGQVYAVVPAFPVGQFRVAVITPEQTISSAWRELLPRVSVAAIGSLLVSVAVAAWLAASITRPVVQITRASEEMARGNYDLRQAIPETDDEIGRLGKAFNAMAREVARSHRAMRDLLANVSHDLRTPLTSIQGFAGALVDGTLAGEAGSREAGRVIVEEAERMSRLVEDLLYLGRIESGEVALDLQRVDVGDLARSAHLRFTFRAEEAGIRLGLEAPDEPIYIFGDAHRLGRVLDNLLDNALKHTPRGGAVTIRVERRSAARGRSASARLEVHNTGSSIPPGELERVFERFYQLDRARAGSDGRGLGLSIAREIVQAHGGTIHAESAPATGTAFAVELQVLGGTAEGGLLSPAAPVPKAVGAGATRRW